ncbi:MAG: nucleotide sugar dehydrogenase [Chloroflexi bacterium]|nr:nucleotide sugar dehydrogenase [Chloroflexota bacterium]
MRKICVIGVGYVGLVTGTCFADLGNQVTCLDISAERVEKLKRGEMPIYEPGLEELVGRNVAAKRLLFTTSYPDAVPGADFIFIAVNTPPSPDGEADLQYVRMAAESIAQVLSNYAIIVNKSTVPVGTGDAVAEILQARGKKVGVDFDVVSNPEFLAEGTAVYDFMQPDRVVLGGTNREAAEKVAQLYLPLRCTIMTTDLRTAEMIKYASNAFLATRISFINEIATICEKVGADVKEVAAGMGLDKRIGRAFLNAGIGYGGSCFEGDETVFVLNSPNVATESLEALFAKSGEAFQGDEVQVITPEHRRVLAFDLETGKPTLAQVSAITRRPYTGTLVSIETSMGRRLRVTADHPVVLASGDTFKVVPALMVSPGDQLLALCELPSVEQSASLNLIDLLRGTALEDDVYVSPVDFSFVDQYAQFAPHIRKEMLRYPDEIKQGNRMSLRLFRELSERGVLDVPAERLQLYTAKGAATKINAVIPVDADLMRLCGYYLAEGYISQDAGRADAVRERVGFSFHENESEYIDDVQRILKNWGLKHITRHSTHAITTLVSSRVFAWFLRDVLQCGICSSDKALPRLAFNVPTELRYELVRGAFSGDGAVTSVQDGKNLMLEYATVSKPLADGMTLLLQTLGIVPSIRQRWMNKSTRIAFILRVSGYAQLSALQNVFGEKHRAKIEQVLSGYQRHIQQHGFTKRGAYAQLTVSSVHYEDVKTNVYSMETSTGTLIAASGLVCHNCFPKDVKALTWMAEINGCHPQLLRSVQEINRDMRRQVIARLREHLGPLRGKTVAIWGLAFKPNTDDVREAASLDIIHILQNEGAKVRAYDPVAIQAAQRVSKNIEFCDNAYSTAEGADALVLVTEWNEFKQVDLAEVAASMKQKIFIDGRNIYDPHRMRDLGFVYRGIGRGF